MIRYAESWSIFDDSGISLHTEYKRLRYVELSASVEPGFEYSQCGEVTASLLKINYVIMLANLGRKSVTLLWKVISCIELAQSFS